MDWLKLRPHDSCCKEAGQATPSMGSLKWTANDSCFGVDDTCCRTSVESVHVKPSALTDGTRLEALESGASGDVDSGSLDAHRLRGVVVSTYTRSVETLRHASQIPNDASCSSSVDVYQHFSSPSHAWSTATAIASRQRLPPALDGIAFVFRVLENEWGNSSPGSSSLPPVLEDLNSDKQRGMTTVR